MENQPGTHRKRPITACLECHRSKKRCNRAMPCSVCVARKIPNRCTYSQPTRLLTSTTSSQAVAEVVFPYSPGETIASSDRASSPTLSERLGYSSANGNRVFGASNHLSLSERIFQSHQKGTERFLSSLSKEKICDLAMQLPPENVVRELVDVYFAKVNRYFSILEQYYFEKAHATWNDAGLKNIRLGTLENLSPDLLFFPALLFQVLAVAILYLPLETSSAIFLQIDDGASGTRTSERYSDKGMEIMATLGRNDPTITAVEQELLRSFWLKNLGRGKEAWHVLGSSIRMAQELGLHLQDELRQDSITSAEETLVWLWYDEYKRRLWTKLFTWDSNMSFNLCRPRIINASDCTIKTPIDCDIPLGPSTRVPMAPGEHDRPSCYTPHVFQYIISQLIHEVLSTGIHKRNAANYQNIIMIHDRVTSILNELPAAVRPQSPDESWDVTYDIIPVHRQHIINVASTFLLALYRPHAGKDSLCRERAVQAALDVLRSQQQLFELLAARNSQIYVLSCYAMNASLFLAVTTAEYPPDNTQLFEKISYALNQALDRIIWMRTRSPLAKAGGPVLKSCIAMMERSFQAHLQSQNPQPVSLLTPWSQTSLLPSDTFSDRGTFLPPNAGNFQRPDFADLGEAPTLNYNNENNSWMFESVTETFFDIDSFMNQMS